MRFTVPYLGNRTYVQGTTVFDALEWALDRNVVIKFSRPMYRNILEAVEGDTTAPCQFTWDNVAGKQHLGVREVGQTDYRIPYDEETIAASATYEGRTASFSPKKLMDIVAVNKRLLHQMAPPRAGEQYLFSRLDLIDAPYFVTPITLEVSGKAGDTYMSKVTMGFRLGTLYFTKHKKL